MVTLVFFSLLRQIVSVWVAMWSIAINFTPVRNMATAAIAFAASTAASLLQNSIILLFDCWSILKNMLRCSVGSNQVVPQN